MRKIKLKYYEVSYDANVDWGGTRDIRVIGKFSYYEDAKEYAKGRGAYGDANVTNVNKTIIIFDTLDEALGKHEEEMKEKALKKLTKAERELLGL